VIGLEDDYWLVLHLMIAGRLHWFEPDRKVPAKSPTRSVRVRPGTLTLTEAGTKRRAGPAFFARQGCARHASSSGLEPLEATRDEFAGALRREITPLKRALTDPRFDQRHRQTRYSMRSCMRHACRRFALTSRISDGTWRGSMQRCARLLRLDHPSA